MTQDALWHVTQMLSLAADDFLVCFGNPEGQDHDLLAVVGARGVWAWDAGGIDLFCVGHEDLLERIQALDPRVTEPLLTGRLCAGGEAAFAEAQDLLFGTRPSREVARQLWWEGVSLLSALAARAGADSARPVDVRFLTDLGFCQSLHLLARSYGAEAPCGILTLTELEAASPLLREIRKSLAALKRGDRQELPPATELVRRVEAQWIGWEGRRNASDQGA